MAKKAKGKSKRAEARPRADGPLTVARRAEGSLTVTRAEGSLTHGRQKSKVPISERAVLLRVNRKLAKEREVLRTWRSGTHPAPYFHLDLNRNAVIQEHVNLEPFARKLGVLQPWESMEG